MGDGLYTAFAPPGVQTLTEVDAGVTREIGVVTDQTVRLDFFLNPGLIFIPVIRR